MLAVVQRIGPHDLSATLAEMGALAPHFIDKPIAALLDGLPVENHAHHESERQRLTGRRSFIFNARGITGFVPGVVLLAAVSRPSRSS